MSFFSPENNRNSYSLLRSEYSADETCRRQNFIALALSQDSNVVERLLNNSFESWLADTENCPNRFREVAQSEMPETNRQESDDKALKVSAKTATFDHSLDLNLSTSRPENQQRNIDPTFCSLSAESAACNFSLQPSIQ